MGRIWELVEELNASTIDAGGGSVGPALPRSAGAPWELLTHPSDPRERLVQYLDAWADMDESVWPEANVKAVYEDIMDIFREHPEAERWFADWRGAHPRVRLA